MAVKRSIAFFVPNQVQLLDLTGPVQVFYEANCYGAHYELLYCAVEEGDVNSTAGLRVSGMQHYATIVLHPGDYIFLPGAGMEYLRSVKFKCQKQFFEWLLQNNKAGVNICSVCTGAFILAETGLLNFKNCTTHWKRTPELKKAHPDLKIADDVLFTGENGVYTSAGITVGIDLALSIVEEHYGPFFTHKVSRELLVYYRRSGGHTQQSVYLNYRNHVQQGIHAVQDWMIENLDKEFTIQQLALVANMGERNLTRVFKKATGVTINQYKKELRLEKLKTLRQNPAYKREALADELGYRSTRQLQRIESENSAAGIF